MGIKTKNYTIPGGSWEQCRDKVRQLFQQISTLDIPLMETSGGGVIDRDDDPTSDTFGELTLIYNTNQFDESPAGTFHIQHFHTEDTERTCVGVDTEDGSGAYDTLVGYQAGKDSSIGFNTLIGAECGKTITTGFANVGIGALTFSEVDGRITRNTAIGYYNQLHLLSRNNYSSAAGNTSIGAFCASYLVTGLWNVAIGYYTLEENQYGIGNFAIGARSFQYLNSTERVITAFADAGGGQLTITTTTTDLTNGDEIRVTATVNYDGKYTIANVTGTTLEITKAFVSDEAVGYVTWETEGCYNVGVGMLSGYSSVTAGLNTYIGAYSGYLNVSGKGNIFIGHRAGYSETGSNKLYIESSDSVTPLIYGEFDNDFVKINGQLEVFSTSTPQLKLSYGGSTNATFSVDSNGDLVINASGGGISFGNENLNTTGTGTFGNLSTAGTGTFGNLEYEYGNIADPSIVAWWEFINSADDKSLEGNDGTLTSGASVTTDPGVLYLDGTNDYVSLDADTSLDIDGEITISAWVLLDAGAHGNEMLFGAYLDSGAYSGYAVMINANKVQYWSSIKLAWVAANTTINDKKWHHIVISVTVANANFYLDGVADGTPASNYPGSWNGAKRIGCDTSLANFFKGRVSNLMIFNRALTANEINKLYSAQSKYAVHASHGHFTQDVTIGYSLTVTGDINTFGDVIASGDVHCLGGIYHVGGTDDPGVTGSFEDNNGNTVTVTGGIITDLGT